MRQNGPQRRGRGRPGGRRGNSNSPNRSFDSSGPDVKIRGTASTVYEKYTTLAREAILSGDRVAAENFYQHAEHYYRVMQTTKQQRQTGDAEQPENRARVQQNRDDRNNVNGSETDDDKAVLIEDSNISDKFESPATQSGAANETDVNGIEAATSKQEEGPEVPMNPAELAAMSGSGRNTRTAKNSNGEDSDDADKNEPAARRQSQRRRSTSTLKTDSQENSAAETGTTDSAAKEDVD